MATCASLPRLRVLCDSTCGANASVSVMSSLMGSHGVAEVEHRPTPTDASAKTDILRCSRAHAASSCMWAMDRMARSKGPNFDVLTSRSTASRSVSPSLKSIPRAAAAMSSASRCRSGLVLSSVGPRRPGPPESVVGGAGNGVLAVLGRGAGRGSPWPWSDVLSGATPGRHRGVAGIRVSVPDEC